MANKKTIITPNNKLRFNIEIDLSIQQLKYLCEMAGDDEYNYLVNYFDLSADVFEKPITISPDFCLGLGADINDILSTGFLFLSKQESEIMNTKLSLNDLCFHPYRIKLEKIKSLKTELIDVEVCSNYMPIIVALDPEGNAIGLKNNSEK